MFTPSPDYLQQLFAYLQAGQQLLQQWAVAGGGPQPVANPFMPPAVPAAGQPMSSAPFPAMPAPSAPDYAQQLFGYLQAWRQYLEQSANAAPTTTPLAAPAPGLGGLLQTGPGPHHGGGSEIPTPPPDPDSTKSNMLKDDSNGSKLPDPKDLIVAPVMKSQTQAPGSDRERLEILIPPFMNTGNMIDPLAQQVRGEDTIGSSVRAAAPGSLSDRATPRAATAFQKAIDSVDPAMVQPINVPSLFSQGSETPSG